MNSRKNISQAITLLCAFALTLLQPLVSTADDVDIYSPLTSTDHRAKILLMIDTSASMNQNAKSGAITRLDRVKDSIYDFVRSASGVDVGISVFNGVDRGGSILYPATNLDEDLCPDDNCDSVTLKNYVMADVDDGLERETAVNLYSLGASLGGRVNNTGSRGWTSEESNGQTVVQTGNFFEESEVLPFSLTENGEITEIGIRFVNFNIFDNSHITTSRITFEWAGQEWLSDSEGAGIIKARIYLDTRLNAPEFKDQLGFRVSDRPKSSTFIEWDIRRPSNWNENTDDPSLVVTPDLAPLINDVYPRGYDGPATFIITPAPDASLTPDTSIHLLGNHFRPGTQLKPRLVYNHFLDPYTPPTELNARRFDELYVPRGATITSAHVEFSHRNVADPTESIINITAEAIGDSPHITTTRGDISARQRGSEIAVWPVPHWHGNDERHKTSDISHVVQEVVSRDDWCAGNALMLFFEGTGERFTLNYRAGKTEASSITITYDPRTIDRNDKCTNLVGEDLQQYRPSEEIIQKTLAGEMIDAGTLFDVDEHEYHGMKFDNIDLGPDDIVATANVQLAVDSPQIVNSNITMFVDADTGSEPLSKDIALNSKISENVRINWLIEDDPAGQTTTSVDLAPLIQAAIDDPSWTRGSSITLIYRAALPGTRIRTRTHPEGGSPLLTISKQVSGADARDIPIRTARDELRERIDSILASGNTPLLDGLYESAQYMSGGDVVHGRIRGEQINTNVSHRLSDPSSYTGGSVFRPTGCTDDNLNSTDCVTEEIVGNAQYIAPDSVECRPNQIMLISDGDPTPSPAGSPSLIRALTGDASCSASVPGAECAIELASWLGSSFQGKHPVNLNSVGFDYSSNFLENIARASGGQSYSVSSSTELAEAFRQITNRAEFSAGSISTPGAPVSQFNRTTHSGELFYGMFKPKASRPLWLGNIKKYFLGLLEDGSVGVVDAIGNPLIDPQSDIGAFNIDAISAWSTGSDANDVTQGGAASRLILDRKILTSPMASNNLNFGGRNLIEFHQDESSITAADIGVSGAEREAAIRWFRGEDVNDEDGDGNTGEPRQLLGAAIHSNPTVIDYVDANNNVTSVVFAATQEGYFHAFDTETGKELWAFIPHELYRNIGEFYRDSNVASALYGADGGIDIRIKDVNGNAAVDPSERAFVTFGMRRGGSHYYTLDISDIDSPSIEWTADPSRTGYEELGQTWSTPVSTKIPTMQSGVIVNKDVLIFANGFNPVNDQVNRTEANALEDKGAIFIVDADDGDVIHKFTSADHSEMTWSIPSRVNVVDNDFDGDVDTLFVGDLGGNLWRVDFDINRNSDGDVVVNEPLLTLAARLADRPFAEFTPTSLANPGGDRRFFHPPDVAIVEPMTGGRSYGVSIGSGRRDSPNLLGTNDRLFFMLLPIEKPTSDRTITEWDLQDVTSDIGLAAGKTGWWIDLSPGEKILGKPVLLDSTLLATTYVPPVSNADPCAASLGSGRFYAINMITGESQHDFAEDEEELRYVELKVKGIPPPVSVLISELSPNSPAVLVGTESVGPISNSPSRWRTHWIDE